MATELFVLAISPQPLAILIAFVAGHDDDAAHRRGRLRGGENMDGPHDVGRIGRYGLPIRQANQRLGGQMKHELRLDPLHCASDRVEIADIGIARIDHRFERSRGEQILLAGRRQRQAEHVRAQSMQPQRQPGALETGMPEDENPLAGPETRLRRYQVFHGAVPVLHRSSR